MWWHAWAPPWAATAPTWRLASAAAGGGERGLWVTNCRTRLSRRTHRLVRSARWQSAPQISPTTSAAKYAAGRRAGCRAHLAFLWLQRGHGRGWAASSADGRRAGLRALRAGVRRRGFSAVSRQRGSALGRRRARARRGEAVRHGRGGLERAQLAGRCGARREAERRSRRRLSHLGSAPRAPQPAVTSRGHACGATALAGARSCGEASRVRVERLAAHREFLRLHSRASQRRGGDAGPSQRCLSGRGRQARARRWA